MSEKLSVICINTIEFKLLKSKASDLYCNSGDLTPYNLDEPLVSNPSLKFWWQSTCLFAVDCDFSDDQFLGIVAINGGRVNKFNIWQIIYGFDLLSNYNSNCSKPMRYCGSQTYFTPEEPSTNRYTELLADQLVVVHFFGHTLWYRHSAKIRHVSVISGTW